MNTRPEREPLRRHPAVVAISIFMAGLVLLVGVILWADRSGASGPRTSTDAAAASSGTQEPVPAPAASAAPAASGPTTDVNPTPPATAVIPSHHEQAAAGSTSSAPQKPFPAELPPLTKGLKVVRLTPEDVTREIAPGVKFQGWTFSGGAPGPTIHVEQGQKIHIELTNNGAIPHSIDFHAARIAPTRAFRDVKPKETITFDFTASDAGVFMYHCGTPPVLAHIASGMYGAIIVEPKGGWQPKADRSYVLVASEWYLNGGGKAKPAGLDMEKACDIRPDYVTWSGFAAQYKDHPLAARKGENVRFFVMDAGPSFNTDFHIVGSMLDRAWTDGDPAHVLTDMQTVLVPAGGGAVFDEHFDENGLYPFVSHSFASVDLGQVGLVDVGGVGGTMSH